MVVACRAEETEGRQAYATTAMRFAIIVELLDDMYASLLRRQRDLERQMMVEV